ncbi:50S ribosomal protein L15 [Demequina sp. SO4-18]|uniref:50S ribosomal protein L15 n=1 Tax=Demequina sp. SO4-18 TaxID=3401026 RepID=UPI003B5AAB4D
MADEKKAAADKAETPAKKPAAKKAPAAKSSSTTAAKKPAAKKAPAKKPAAKSEAASASSGTASAAKKAPAAKSSSSTTAANKPAAKKAAANDAESTDSAPKVTTLKMHHLRPAEGSHARKIRVGRGEGGRKGKTAGRGTKGTGARYQVPERFEGGQTPIHMRIPKLPGFKNPFRTEYQVVNVSQIAELFPKGGKVTKADLVDKGAVRKNQLVKVLGDGDISVKVEIVDADKVSQSAKTKIEGAGGSVNES